MLCHEDFDDVSRVTVSGRHVTCWCDRCDWATWDVRACSPLIVPPVSQSPKQPDSKQAPHLAPDLPPSPGQPSPGEPHHPHHEAPRQPPPGAQPQGPRGAGQGLVVRLLCGVKWPLIVSGISRNSAAEVRRRHTPAHQYPSLLLTLFLA